MPSVLFWISEFSVGARQGQVDMQLLPSIKHIKLLDELEITFGNLLAWLVFQRGSSFSISWILFHRLGGQLGAQVCLHAGLNTSFHVPTFHKKQPLNIYMHSCLKYKRIGSQRNTNFFFFNKVRDLFTGETPNLLTTHFSFIRILTFLTLSDLYLRWCFFNLKWIRQSGNYFHD